MTEKRNDGAESTSDREIVLSRLYDASRDLVWKAWTDPKHIGSWWGPRGFSTTTRSMEIKPGGTWRFTMHAPDGTDFADKISYLEVERPSRLVYDHGVDDGKPAHFRVSVTFREEAGKTRMEMRMVFPTAEACEQTRVIIAKAGGNGTWDRLEEYLLEGDREHVFEISRVFDAPRDVLFDLWTDVEHLRHWCAPKGCAVRYKKADIQPGGTALYCMTTPDGHEMWGKVHYREITRPTLLVYLQAFSNEQGGITRHPMSPTWPPEMLTRIEFAAEGQRTRLTLKWMPVGATPEELDTFVKAKAGMSQGWGGSFEGLDAYIAKKRG